MERITHAMRQEYWTRIVQECNESGMRKKKWCELHHISSKTFYRWQNKIRMEKGTEIILAKKQCVPIELVELKEPAENMDSSSSDLVIEKDGITVKTGYDVSEEQLMKVIRCLSNV